MGTIEHKFDSTSCMPWAPCLPNGHPAQLDGVLTMERKWDVQEGQEGQEEW
jgi:hypothetical protein